jgi:hypothetical protein
VSATAAAAAAPPVLIAGAGAAAGAGAFNGRVGRRKKLQAEGISSRCTHGTFACAYRLFFLSLSPLADS